MENPHDKRVVADGAGGDGGFSEMFIEEGDLGGGYETVGEEVGEEGCDGCGSAEEGDEGLGGSVGAEDALEAGEKGEEVGTGVGLWL